MYTSLTHLRTKAAPSVRSGALTLLAQQPRRTYVEWSTSSAHLHNWTESDAVKRFIHDRIQIMTPTRVHLCDGSETENAALIRNMEYSGTLIRLNPRLRPNSYVARSPASDVARVEEQTFICSESKDEAGSTNNWRDPEEASSMMGKLFDGCMRGRTMYVIPFCMGPLSSPFSMFGIQITDSPYVVANMRIMTRMGKRAMDQLGPEGEFVPCVHSVGAPLGRGQEDAPWPSNPKDKYIVHFPEQRKIWSYGSGYGGNALLGKKCLALRIASQVAREEGWLAEHMLIVGITNPQGKKKYFAAAFPSACGKTNMAMMLPKLPGWKVECVGDDIAWMRIREDGRLYAVNPEAGFFGVAPGTSKDSNPNAMATLKKNVLFTNVAITEQGDVWWEGMTEKKPRHLQSWLRTDWTPDAAYQAAHPNARFTVSADQCPVIDPNWESPEGVPISGIIFGGRRSTGVPLVYQSFDWEHGVFVGASMNSETTAAASGKRGVLRNDPFAMRPFCGYNIGDYFGHWQSFSQRTKPEKLPKIFHVNWFRKSAHGKFLWPGFGDNIRVIEWIFNRSDEDNKASNLATESPIGFVPKPGAINTEGLDIRDEDMTELFSINKADWKQEVSRTEQFFTLVGQRLPQEMKNQLGQLSQRLDTLQS